MQGVVRVYDPITGVGVVVRDDGGDVFLGPGSLDGSVFRTLRQGQRIIFDLEQRDGKDTAVNLKLGADGY